jgi:hypothetical protein
MPHQRDIGRIVANLLFLGCAGALFVISAQTLLHLFTVQSTVSGDRQIFMFIANRLLQGDVPYRDIFDFNFPGIYLLHMLCITIYGKSDQGFFLFDLSMLYIGCCLLASFTWKHSKILSLLLVALWIYFYAHSYVNYRGQRDLFMVPFLAGGFAIFFHRLGEKNIFWFFLAGALMGAAFSIKPTPILLFAMLPLWMLWAYRHDRRFAFRAIASFCAGVAAPLLAIMAWLFFSGGLADFYEIVTQFLPAYRDSWARFIKESLAYVLPAGMICAFLLMCFFRKHFSRENSLLIIAFLFGLFHLYIQHKGWGYHRSVTLAFTLLIMAWTLIRIRASMPATAYAVICISTALFTQAWFKTDVTFDEASWSKLVRHDSLQSMDDAVNAAIDALPEQLRRNALTPEGKNVQFFARAREELFKAAYVYNWRPPLRHVYILAFDASIRNSYTNQLREQFIEDMMSKAPPVIVAGKMSNPIIGIMRRDEKLAPFMREHYRLFRDNPSYSIYIRKH